MHSLREERTEMESLNKIRAFVDKALTTVCSVLFGIMILVGMYQILTRYLFHRPSTVSEELLTYTFTWMALLISAYVFGKRDHMRMGFLADKVTGTKRKVLEIAIEVLCVTFAFVVMLMGGMEIRTLSMTQKTASLGIHMGTVYTVVPVTGALMIFYGVLNVINLIKGNDKTLISSEDGKEENK